MKKNVFILYLFICCITSNAQVAASLGVSDTRSANEVPNFYNHSIRADFKLRDVIGVPGQGYYSTSLTVAQWDATNNSGDKNHQLNFNNGGIFYRNAYPLDSQWGAWRQVLMTDENGNLSIGTLNSLGSLTISKTPGQNDAHIFFGEPLALAGQPSARLCFGGTGIQNSGFTWVPASNLDEGKLFLSFGGYENGIKNPIKVTFQSNGNVGIGTTTPDAKLAVNGTIHSKEVKVDMNGWSDFVFKRKYNLPTLQEVEKHIIEKGHLENIPNEEEVLKNGINLGEMDAKLLQKIEELTLYMIEQERKSNHQSLEIKKSQDEVDKLRKENDSFKSILERLLKIEQKLK